MKLQLAKESLFADDCGEMRVSTPECVQELKRYSWQVHDKVID